MPETGTQHVTQPATIPSRNRKWLNRGLVVRLAIYLVGSHLFAAFLFLLFELGGHRH
ncbi:DUF6126 family protein [Streptomyces sp. ICBB 8177]|uniref:DUF6126 family protein n=1 Tax=Streptomyces sp. ICBB 8177 TaxID=563922 RepID=UPI0018EE996D|nr:DUF6126 family protein [Streptomyces sp. ICBB 8177]